MLSDPENKEYVLKNNGINLVQQLLKSRNENILISAITTLMFLITPDSKEGKLLKLGIAYGILM